MKLRTTKDFWGIPSGSVLSECKDGGALYFGSWSSALGTWRIGIPKAYCVKVEPEMADSIKQALERVAAELAKMSDEDFRKLIERHKQGDFAIAYMKSLRGEA